MAQVKLLKKPVKVLTRAQRDEASTQVVGNHPYGASENEDTWHETFRVEAWERGKELKIRWANTLASARQDAKDFRELYPKASVVIRANLWRVVEVHQP